MIQIKNLKFILCPLLALCMYNVSAQFITLKGKQFIDQSGQPFYPVICNYAVNLFCGSCVGSGAYPEDEGGGFGEFDPADVELRPVYRSMDILPVPGTGLGIMKAAFGKMKAMGFNTVRLIGWCPMINHVCENGAYTGSLCYVMHNPTENNPCTSWEGYPVTYNEPFTTDYNLNNVVMPRIKAAMQAARDSGLNVMLDCLWIGDFSNSDGAANTANDILTAIAASIAADAGGHPELLAYDLYNEPHWNVWEQNTNVKTKICQYTSMWYNNMKAIDPNHLITNGDVDAADVMDWDPAVQKLDFNCLHPYPDFYGAAYEGYNEANMTSRYQALLYWETNNSPIPWIIAETGVAANSTSVAGYIPAPMNGNPIWGSLADQSEWAKEIQQIAINTGSSGFGWWAFADEYYGDGDISNNYYGLLRAGHPIDLGGGVYAYDNSNDKPIVAEAFSANTITHGTAQITQPADYYNAWGGTYYTFSGTVQDQDGNPIKDAVIQGANGAHHAPYIDKTTGLLVTPKNSDGTVKCPASVQFSITTFSKADGSFSLIAPAPSPSSYDVLILGEYDYGKFDHIQVSAAGADVVVPWDQDVLHPSGSPSSSSITLERKPGVWDNPVFELDINSSNSTSTSSPYIVTARHALITGADIVEPTGFADFHASSIVNVWGATGTSLSGIAAEKGSYTHIYCAPVDLDCSLLTDAHGDYYHPKRTTSSTDTSSQVISKDITVSYLLPGINTRLMPNPAENYFYLLAPGDSPVGNVEITDALGHNVYTGKVQMDGQTPLNTSLFASGFYNVHVINNSDSQNFKLIISR